MCVCSRQEPLGVVANRYTRELYWYVTTGHILRNKLGRQPQHARVVQHKWAAAFFSLAEIFPLSDLPLLLLLAFSPPLLSLWYDLWPFFSCKRNGEKIEVDSPTTYYIPRLPLLSSPPPFSPLPARGSLPHSCRPGSIGYDSLHPLSLSPSPLRIISAQRRRVRALPPRGSCVALSVVSLVAGRRFFFCSNFSIVLFLSASDCAPVRCHA